MRMAVTNVERNRARYPYIDDRELASRKAFVERIEKAVQGMKEYYFGREVQGKLDSDQRKQLTMRAEAERADAVRQANAYHTANSSFLNDQSQQQAVIRTQQDQALDRMGNSLDTLKEMATAIDSELKDQEVMLNDLDNEVTEAQVRACRHARVFSPRCPGARTARTRAPDGTLLRNVSRQSLHTFA